MSQRGLRDFQTPPRGKGSCANQAPDFIRETGCCINQVSQRSLAKRSTRDLIVTPSGHAVIPAEQWHEWPGHHTEHELDTLLGPIALSYGVNLDLREQRIQLV